LTVFGLDHAPLVVAPSPHRALLVAFRGAKNDRPSAYLVLGVCAWSALFFSLYYYTTWQGPYMVPSIITLSVPAVAALNRAAIPRNIGWVVGPAYALVLCFLLLRPLAA
jgi:hypothetical protein